MLRFSGLSALCLLAACSSSAMMAKPDLVMKIAPAADAATTCVAQGLGREFQDAMPSIDYTGWASQISVNAPRGGLLAYVTVEPRPGGGSLVKFYNGDLYWPSNQVSGVYPDMARDNWHRAENAIKGCEKAA